MLTRNSLPWATPLALYRCAYTPEPDPSCVRLRQATTKLPLASMATVGWSLAVAVFVLMRNSPVLGVPSAL